MISNSSNSKVKSKLWLPGDAAPVAPAPAFRSVSENYGVSLSDFPTTAPSGTAAGDFLLAYCVSAGFAGTFSMTGDGGQTWTAITELTQNGAGTDQLRAWWAFNNGSLGTVTFHGSNGSTGVGSVAAFTGVNATPLDTTSTLASGTAGVNTTVVPLTTVHANTLRVILGWIGGNYTAPGTAGLVERSHVTYQLTLQTVLDTIVVATPATSPSEVFTHSNSSRAIGHIALRAA